MSTDKCPLEPSLAAINANLTDIKNYVIKWLVICVCTIAMGTKLLDAVDKIIGKGVPAAAAQTVSVEEHK